MSDRFEYGAYCKCQRVDPGYAVYYHMLKGELGLVAAYGHYQGLAAGKILVLRLQRVFPRESVFRAIGLGGDNETRPCPGRNHSR